MPRDGQKPWNFAMRNDWAVLRLLCRTCDAVYCRCGATACREESDGHIYVYLLHADSCPAVLRQHLTTNRWPAFEFHAGVRHATGMAERSFFNASRSTVPARAHHTNRRGVKDASWV